MFNDIIMSNEAFNRQHLILVGLLLFDLFFYMFIKQVWLEEIKTNLYYLQQLLKIKPISLIK